MYFFFARLRSAWSRDPIDGDLSRAQGSQGHHKLFATRAGRSQRSLEAAGAFLQSFHSILGRTERETKKSAHGCRMSPEASGRDVSRAQGAQGHCKLFATQAERSQRSLEAAGAFRRLYHTKKDLARGEIRTRSTFRL